LLDRKGKGLTDRRASDETGRREGREEQGTPGSDSDRRDKQKLLEAQIFESYTTT